jgi:hypothetical protein
MHLFNRILGRAAPAAAPAAVAPPSITKPTEAAAFVDNFIDTNLDAPTYGAWSNLSRRDKLSIGLEVNNAFRPANLNAINDEVQIAAQLVIVLSNIYSTRGVVTDQNLDIISEDLANYAYDHTDATIQAAVDAIQNNAGIQAASVGVPVFVINSAKAAAIFGGMSDRQNPNDIPLRASNNANTLIQVLIQHHPYHY